MNINYNYLNIFDKYICKSKEKSIVIDFDYIKLNSFYYILKYYLNSNNSWFYIKESNSFFCIYNDSLDFVPFGKLAEYDNDILKNVSILISFDVNTFNKLYVRTFSKIDDILYYKPIVKDINNSVIADIKMLVNWLNDAEVVDNYFYETVELLWGDIVGQYDFNLFKINGGGLQSGYPYPKCVNLAIKYNKVIVDSGSIMLPSTSSLLIDRDIIKKLIQFIFRVPFNRSIVNGVFYSGDSKGNYVLVDRNKIIVDSYNGIPQDSDILLSSFYELSYKSMNLFLHAIDLYIEGMKEYDNNKSILFFVSALDSIATALSENKNSHINNIFNIINDTFGYEVVSKNYINYIYKLRCFFSHEGMNLSGINGLVFGVNNVDRHFIIDLDNLVYSFLCKWLLKEVDYEK